MTNNGTHCHPTSVACLLDSSGSCLSYLVDWLELDIHTVGCQFSGLNVKRSCARPKVMGSSPESRIIDEHSSRIPYWDEKADKCFQVFYVGLALINS